MIGTIVILSFIFVLGIMAITYFLAKRSAKMAVIKPKGFNECINSKYINPSDEESNFVFCFANDYFELKLCDNKNDGLVYKINYTDYQDFLLIEENDLLMVIIKVRNALTGLTSCNDSYNVKEDIKFAVKRSKYFEENLKTLNLLKEKINANVSKYSNTDEAKAYDVEYQSILNSDFNKKITETFSMNIFDFKKKLICEPISHERHGGVLNKSGSFFYFPDSNIYSLVYTGYDDGSTKSDLSNEEKILAIDYLKNREEFYSAIINADFNDFISLWFPISDIVKVEYIRDVSVINNPGHVSGLEMAIKAEVISTAYAIADAWDKSQGSDTVLNFSGYLFFLKNNPSKTFFVSEGIYILSNLFKDIYHNL